MEKRFTSRTDYPVIWCKIQQQRQQRQRNHLSVNKIILSTYLEKQAYTNAKKHIKGKGKGKFRPRTDYEGPEGETGMILLFL